MIKIAHRGASGYEAENSLAAFKRAIEMKVDYLEADVQFTKDNVAIIRHDRSLDRTTSLKGIIGEMNSAEILPHAKLSNNELILTLEDLCKLVKEANSKLYVDLKSFGKELEVVTIAQQHLNNDSFILGAFNSEVIKRVKDHHPNVTTVLIMEGNFINLEKEIHDCKCDIVALGYDAIEGNTVRRIQKLGKKVFTWTVNQDFDITRAKSLGVDGITSNFPDRI